MEGNGRKELEEEGAREGVEEGVEEEEEVAPSVSFVMLDIHAA